MASSFSLKIFCILTDFEEVLKLEPGNKMAKLEIDKLEKVSIHVLHY